MPAGLAVPAEVSRERSGLASDARVDGAMVGYTYGQIVVDPDTEVPDPSSASSGTLYAFPRGATSQEVRGGVALGDLVFMVPWGSLPESLREVAEGTLGAGDPSDWRFELGGRWYRPHSVVGVSRIQGFDLAYAVACRGGGGA